ncbi:DnaJ domain [Dillenia turbinata]|uniref:DnaJ domain n=1 Tax=Dillenia turbinata TaxID=194707 RepID=A0AAN8USK1_9MAGN
MECNKDEAIRAIELAEKKFASKDYSGAKRFALKAKNLYPGLEGLSQMLANLDVYVSAEDKINGEPNWYGVLGVHPSADEDTVRKHYRKLALMLHPDKNKSLGAEGAFKLISEAWSLLSDKGKRLLHDQKRNTRGFSKKVPPPTVESVTSPGANGFYNFTKTSSSKSQKSGSRVGPSSAPASKAKPKRSTFWTVCNRCKMQYEYLRVYLNHNLLCPNCHEAFFAVETAPPPSSSSNPWTSSQQRQTSNHHAPNKNGTNSGKFNSSDTKTNTKFQWGPFSRTAGSASSAAQAASVVQQAYEKVKREREEAQAATKREEALRRKSNAAKKVGTSFGTNAAKRRRGMDDAGGRENANQIGVGLGGSGAASSLGIRLGNNEAGESGGTNKPNGMRDVPLFQLQQVLMERAKTEIQKQLSRWDSATTEKCEPKQEKNMKESENREEKATKKPSENINLNIWNQSGCSVDMNIGDCAEKLVTSTSNNRVEKERIEPLSIDVPDPDFHDFDKDRTERSFGDSQVWAAYDDDDGMPRYYAMIHSVISLNPFKMRISWLNSKTNSELGPLNWVGSGFTKTCGDFRVGKFEVNDSLNSFSHKVKWTKGARGAIQIYPRKGDVWALYRNWSPDWNELTTDEMIHKYDMVEVLDDYTDKLSVSVIPLVKVAGFKTVFHRHLDTRQVRTIPKEEMFRFSHQVPSYLLTGQEAPNAPKGCRELDPAATPVELLHVVKDVNEQDIVETDEDVKDAKGVDIPNDKESVEHSAKVEAEENSKSSERIIEVQTVEDAIGVETEKNSKNPERSAEIETVEDATGVKAEENSKISQRSSGVETMEISTGLD